MSEPMIARRLIDDRERDVEQVVAAPESPSRLDLVRSSELVLRAAVSAYLGRYRGQTRLHGESDLRVFLRWRIDQDLDPFTAVRVDIERYVRWLQDVRRYQPSDLVSRRKADKDPAGQTACYTTLGLRRDACGRHH